MNNSARTMIQQTSTTKKRESSKAKYEQSICKDAALAIDNKFDEVQPFILYVQYIVFSFVGDIKDTFPHTWKETSINEISYWTLCGIFSVQEATTLMLNYYRYVMEEYSSYCRKRSNFSQNHRRICKEIYKLINNIENTVWEIDSYEMCTISPDKNTSDDCYKVVQENNVKKNAKAVQEYIQKYSGISNSCDDNTYQEILDCTSSKKNIGSKAFHKDNKAVICPNSRNSTLTNSTVKNNNPIVDETPANGQICNVDTILTESIDEKMEMEFVNDIRNNDNTICHNDGYDTDLENALQMILEDPCNEIPNIEYTSSNEAKHNSEKENNIASQNFNKQSEISIFTDLIECKWSDIQFNFSLKQQEMVNQTIVHYRHLITTESISALEAFKQIEYFLHSLFTDTTK